VTVFLRRLFLQLKMKEFFLTGRTRAEPQRPCDAVNDMLDDHVAQVGSRIVELQRLARELKAMRTLCRVPGKAKNCQVLKVLRTP